MGLEQLSGCADGNTCPGVWVERGQETVLVRGEIDAQVGLALDHGEAIVRIPSYLLVAAAEVLGMRR